MQETQLTKLIEAVKEEGLTKTQLESYHTHLTSLFATAHLELSDKERMAALYFVNHQEKNDITARRKWAASEDGLREITLKHTVRALEKLLSSVKNRIYSQL